MKAGVFFENFGPYHVARLNAASERIQVLGLEWRGRSQTYAWEPFAFGVHFEKRTLLGRDDKCFSNDNLLRCLEKEMAPLSLNAVVVNGWGDFGSLAVISWALKYQIPIIIMSESTAWDEPRKPVKEWIKRQVVGLGSAALAGGTPHRDYLTQLGMPPENIFMGYDAVDNDYFAKNAAVVRSQKSEVRRKQGLPEKYFLASARFVEKKNLPRLIEAYAVYRKSAEFEYAKTEIWDLVLLGDGALRKELEARSLELGVSQWIHMPGFRQYPDLPDYYGCAQAFIHPSTTEQWGLVVNEAMASGLPVLVSNRCGCAPDLVAEGVNGFTFDPFNVQQIAGMMLKVSEPYFPLAAFGEASQHIIADWGPKRFADELFAATETAIKVGPRRASLLQRLILRGLMLR